MTQASTLGAAPLYRVVKAYVFVVLDFAVVYHSATRVFWQDFPCIGMTTIFHFSKYRDRHRIMVV